MNRFFFTAYCQNYLNSSHYRFLKIFTDGSKDPSSGHSGIEFKRIYGFRLTNYVSVYSIDMVGITTALRWIEKIKPLKSIILIPCQSIKVLRGHPQEMILF